MIAAAPQNDAGRITEPPVCVPSASGIMPAATAAAEPDDDPPGVCHVARIERRGRIVRRESGGRGLADDAGAGLLQQHDDRRIRAGRMPL